MSRPRRLWWSFLWTLRCSVSWLIDAVRMAIWTSAEPVSLGPRPYLGDRSDFGPLFRGTGCGSSFRRPRTEPVWLGPRPYLVDRSDFCSLVRGTGCESSFRLARQQTPWVRDGDRRIIPNRQNRVKTGQASLPAGAAAHRALRTHRVGHEVRGEAILGTAFFFGRGDFLVVRLVEGPAE